MQTDKIPDEIMREAREIANCFLYPSSDAANECAADIARALMARDKRAAEIARTTYAKDAFHFELGTAVADRILTHGGRDEQR